LKKLVHSPKI